MNNTMEITSTDAVLDAMPGDDYLALDATEMAQQMRNEGLPPGALLGAALARCRAVNEQVNAVVMDHSELAVERLMARVESGTAREGVPVSYTHLTLPTICSV